MRIRFTALSAAEPLWVVDENNFKIYRVDSTTSEVTQLPFDFDHELAEGMEFGDWYITYGRGLVWVRHADDTVVAIDPDTYQIVDTRTTSPQGGPGVFFVSDDSLWVGNGWNRDLTGIRLP